MKTKILEKIVEPSKIVVGSTFLLKIKVERMQGYDLITENSVLTVSEVNNMSVEELNKTLVEYLSNNNSTNIITESGEKIITEGDYYE